MIDGRSGDSRFAGITVGLSVASTNRIVDVRAGIWTWSASALIVGDVAFTCRKLAELAIGAGRSDDSSANHRARPWMINRNHCGSCITGVAIRFPIATTNRLIDVGASSWDRVACAHVVRDIAFAWREQAELSLRARQAHDATTVANTIRFDALGHNAASLDRALVLRTTLFDALRKRRMSESSTPFFTIGRTMPGACREEMLGTGTAIRFCSSVRNALVVTLAGLHGASFFTSDVAMIFDAFPKKLAGGLGTGVLRSSIVQALAIIPLGAFLAFASAICVGMASVYAFFEEALTGHFALALRSSGLDTTCDEFIPLDTALSLALLLRRGITHCAV